MPFRFGSFRYGGYLVSSGAPLKVESELRFTAIIREIRGKVLRVPFLPFAA
jgi:hypothetical protein